MCHLYTLLGFNTSETSDSEFDVIKRNVTDCFNIENDRYVKPMHMEEINVWLEDGDSLSREGSQLQRLADSSARSSFLRDIHDISNDEGPPHNRKETPENTKLDATLYQLAGLKGKSALQKSLTDSKCGSFKRQDSFHSVTFQNNAGHETDLVFWPHHQHTAQVLLLKRMTGLTS